MKKITRLINEAKKSCKFREHDMQKFRHFKMNNGGDMARSNCKACGAGVQVEAAPEPNSIDIGGSAVAIHCSA